jgi:hypothetical protein
MDFLRADRPKAPQYSISRWRSLIGLQAINLAWEAPCFRHEPPEHDLMPGIPSKPRQLASRIGETLTKQGNRIIRRCSPRPTGDPVWRPFLTNHCHETVLTHPTQTWGAPNRPGVGRGLYSSCLHRGLTPQHR